MNEPEAGQNMEKKCPQCGATLPVGALEGLCPACLLKQGATADTAATPAVTVVPWLADAAVAAASAGATPAVTVMAGAALAAAAETAATPAVAFVLPEVLTAGAGAVAWATATPALTVTAADG